VLHVVRLRRLRLRERARDGSGENDEKREKGPNQSEDRF
jgi:hypothetical protein